MDNDPPAAHRAAADIIRAKLMAPRPGYWLRDEVDRDRGFRVVPPLRLYLEMLSTRLASLGPHFEVPVFRIQGSEENLRQPRWRRSISRRSMLRARTWCCSKAGAISPS